MSTGQKKIRLDNVLPVLVELEQIMSGNGYHIALTGSVLYKGGSNDDVDVIVYPHDPANRPLDAQGLQQLLEDNGYHLKRKCTPDYVNRDVWVFTHPETNFRFDFFLSDTSFK